MGWPKRLEIVAFGMMVSAVGLSGTVIVLGIVGRPGGFHRVVDQVASRPNACKAQNMVDPEGTARRNASQGRVGVYIISGFVERVDAPGVMCEAGDRNAYEKLPSAGGIAVTDIPGQACGRPQPGIEQMEIYNRSMASTTEFQRATGCKAATVCEQRYVKNYYLARTADPDCATYALALGGAAVNATPIQLSGMITKAKAADADKAMTFAYIAALENARWENARVLVQAGVDPNARIDREDSGASAIKSQDALEAIFRRTQYGPPKKDAVEQAMWHADHGLKIAGDGAERALTQAVDAQDRKQIAYLLESPVTGGGPKHHDPRLAGPYEESALSRVMDRAMDNKDDASRRGAEELAREFIRRGAAIPRRGIWQNRLDPTFYAEISPHAS